MVSCAAPTFSFDESLHLYTDENGLVLPSVTQVLKANGFINFDGIPPAVLERKRKLGSLVHKVTELYDRNEELSCFEIPDAVLEYVEGYVNFRADSGFVPELIEQRMLGEIHGMVYGMTPDRVGLLNGEPHILELKTGATEHPAWGLQLAGYDLGLNKKPSLQRAALQLGPKFTRGYKLFPYPEPTDYQIWVGALAQTIWKQNKGLFTLENIPEREAA